MKTTVNTLLLESIKKSISNSFIAQFFFVIALSWLYALTAQMILPIYPVVITILPLPIYLMVYLFGFPAAYAFIVYLLQGALGAPFFAHGRSGIEVLVGPSGGYLFGMALAALMLAVTLDWYKNNWHRAGLVFLISEVIVIGLGLAQLSFFVEPSVLLVTGFNPFFLGEILKVVVATLFVLYDAKK